MAEYIGKPSEYDLKSQPKSEALSQIVEKPSRKLEKNLDRIAYNLGQFRESAEADVASLSKIDHTDARKAVVNKEYRELIQRVNDNIDTLNSLIRLLGESEDQSALNIRLQLQSILETIHDAKKGDDFRKMNGLKNADSQVEDFIQEATSFHTAEEIPPQILQTFEQQPDILPMYHLVSMDVTKVKDIMEKLSTETEKSEPITLDQLYSEIQKDLAALGDEPYPEGDEISQKQFNALVAVSKETGALRNTVDAQIFPMLEKMLHFDSIKQTFEELQRHGAESAEIAEAIKELVNPSDPKLAAEMVSGWRIPSDKEFTDLQQLITRRIDAINEKMADLQVKINSIINFNKNKDRAKYNQLKSELAVCEKTQSFVKSFHNNLEKIRACESIIVRSERPPSFFIQPEDAAA